MENSLIKSRQRREKRSLRVRKSLKGTSSKPRLSVYKSNAHIHAQLIDDEAGVTLGSISTFSKEFRNSSKTGRNKEAAIEIGKRIAEIAKEKNIDTVVFDRGPFKYHGVIAALADRARESGLRF